MESRQCFLLVRLIDFANLQIADRFVINIPTLNSFLL